MPDHSIYDVVILGCGPAGLQAAIHAARKKASVLLLGRMNKSSLYWAHVENLCCQFKVTGEELLRVGREQALGFGAEIVEEDALHIAPQGRFFEITTEGGAQVVARTLVVATGTTRNKLGIPGEKELLGRGVSYCVECDGGFFKNEIVAVVGGQSAAAGGALTLTHFATSVHLVCEKIEVAEALKAQVLERGVILHEGVKPVEIVGTNSVEGLVLSDGSRLPLAGVFIELGAKGVLELAATLGLNLDESMKYVDTDKKMRTNVPGVFAAGDIAGPPLQIAKAIGEGCVAGLEAAAYAKKIKEAQESSEEEEED